MNMRPSTRQTMRGVIALIFLSAVASGSQSTVAPLSETLRAHVKGDRFDLVTSIRGLPLGVRGALQTLFASQASDIAVDIAEPGARFQETDLIASPRLPIRRLVAAGCSVAYCLVYYERGGRAHTWHVALFHHAPGDTRFEWGGSAPPRLATIGDVRNAVLSGAVKNSSGSW